MCERCKCPKRLNYFVDAATKAANENGHEVDSWTAEELAGDMIAYDDDISEFPEAEIIAAIIDNRSRRAATT